MMIGVLYFIGTLHLLPIRLCMVSNKHVKLVLEKRKKKRQFYSRGACSFKPYFFLLASNIVATFSRSITEVTVYRMDANSAHLQRLCSFQSVITPFLKTCLSPSSQRYLNFFHLELFVSTTFFFFLLFLPFSRVQLSFLNEHA